MTPIQTIFKHARRELAILACTCIAAFAIVFGSAYWNAQEKEGLGQVEAQASARQSELNQKQTDLNNIQAHIDKFKALKQKGLVGVADREGWAEQFNTSRQTVGLGGVDLTYTLDPPKVMSDVPASPDDIAAPIDPTAALQHDLQFELRGVHEVELLKLLRDYKANVDGQYRIQSCELNNPSSTGLQAKCTLRFFTLPNPSKSLLPP